MLLRWNVFFGAIIYAFFTFFFRFNLNRRFFLIFLWNINTWVYSLFYSAEFRTESIIQSCFFINIWTFFIMRFFPLIIWSVISVFTARTLSFIDCFVNIYIVRMPFAQQIENLKTLKLNAMGKITPGENIECCICLEFRLAILIWPIVSISFSPHPNWISCTK